MKNTRAQVEALKRANDIIKEHFDAHILVVEADVYDPAPDNVMFAEFSGGKSRALGMLARHQAQMLADDQKPEQEWTEDEL